jgi:uracil-DNA glycosylase
VGDASDTLRRMLADVQASAAAYGQITSTCGCCFRKLEDALSVERGIGPICWAKFN